MKTDDFLELKFKHKPLNQTERKPNGWVTSTSIFFYRKLCGVILLLNAK